MLFHINLDDNNPYLNLSFCNYYTEAINTQLNHQSIIFPGNSVNFKSLSLISNLQRGGKD